jgi:AcrR family transcriptional regulator
MSLTPAQTRRQRQRGEARRAILDATEVLLIEAGGEDFSIRGLAERCGYTPPTIYHYFGDKEGLVEALLEERFARLLASVEQVKMGSDPVDNLRRMVVNFLEFGRENPEFYRLIVARSRRGTDRTPPSAEQARAILGEPWAVLEAAGRLHASAQAAGQSLWSLLHGLTALQVGRPDIDWAPDLVETAIEAMLRGLIRPPAGSGSRSDNGREL